MLNMVVIAEGVETLKQVIILKQDIMLGFYFSKPLPIEEASKQIDEIKILK